MINLAKNDNTIGFLTLLLALLLIHALTSGLNRSKPPEIFHDNDLFVQMGGDIKSPGVYAIDEGINLLELIDKAGGLNVDVSLPDRLRDCTLSSGDKIVIKNGFNGCTFIHGEMSAFHKIVLGIPISLNKESEKGLTALPWIGKELAQSIVQERSRRGSFKHMNEIMEIRGIGPKLYKKIQPYIKL